MRKFFAVISIVVASASFASAASASYMAPVPPKIANMGKFPILKVNKFKGEPVVSYRTLLGLALSEQSNHSPIYDSALAAKTREFQKSVNLKPNGIVNHATWRAVIVRADANVSPIYKGHASKVKVDSGFGGYIVTTHCQKGQMRAFYTWPSQGAMTPTYISACEPGGAIAEIYPGKSDVHRGNVLRSTPVSNKGRLGPSTYFIVR